MKVFIAGGTGVVGLPLVAALTAQGHTVTATSRTSAGAATIDRAGGTGRVVDPLDRSDVLAAVAGSGADVVIHQLTAIESVDPKRFDQSFAATNELRTTAVDHLLVAATETGAKRLIAQSFTGWTNPRGRRPNCTESDPLDTDPDASAIGTLAAIAHLEATVTARNSTGASTGSGPDGVVVRYGHLYGGRTAYDPGGDTYQAVSARQFPVVGGGGGVWSFTHVDDAVSATVAAVEGGPAGLYNIVDDEPAPVADWLPAYAAAIGAPRPRKAPAWVAKRMIGSHGVRMMTEASGSSNRRARDELGWEPGHRSWRTGFATCAAGARQPSAS